MTLKNEVIDRDVIALRARGILSQAVAAGKLRRLSDGKTPCQDCGNPATMYDHRDYSKPLEVEPVCRRCNTRRGPAKPYVADWNKTCGTNWCHLDGGDGDIAEPSGRFTIAFDETTYEQHAEYLLQIEFRDPDTLIAFKELSRFQKVWTSSP